MHFMTSLWPRIRPLLACVARTQWLALVVRVGRSLGDGNASPALARPQSPSAPPAARPADCPVDDGTAVGPSASNSGTLLAASLASPRQQSPIPRDGAQGELHPPARDGRAARRRACARRRERLHARPPRHAAGGPPSPRGGDHPSHYPHGRDLL